MGFVVSQDVLFRHCDPAGIVFYPRYFEMINDSVEAFFAKVLDLPFSVLHQDGGVPTVKTETHFVAPSRLGDRLAITVNVLNMGYTSLTIDVTASCTDTIRFRSKSTLVLIDGTGKPRKWPDVIKCKLRDFQERNRND